MLLTPRAPTLAPRPLVTLLPRKLPISLHPSCVLALLPQNDDKWFDYSGRGNHGIVHGATPTAKGSEGFAWEFDMVDDWIDCGNDASLNITDAITAAARVRIDSLGTSQVIIGKFGALGNRAHLLYFHTTAIRYSLFLVGADGSVRDAFSPIPTLGVWQCIAASYDRSQIIAYLNGVAGAPVAYTQPIASTTVNEWIGNAVAFNHLFHGLIDYVLIYNQAWSPRPQDPNYLPEIDPHLT